MTAQEAYLLARAYTDKVAEGGGGGTTNYNLLSNKPQIAGTELQGNKSLADLGIASAQSVSNIANGESINNFADVENALSAKQNALTAGRNINLSNDEVKAGVFVEAGVDIGIDEYSIQSGTETYTIAESGLYEIFYCLTLQSAVSLSLPESANVLIERDLSISNHPVKHIVVELEAGSTVTITQTSNQWRTVMSGILKLDAISVNNVVHADSVADSTVSYKLPNDDKYYLVIGTAVGNSVSSNSTRDDTSGGNPTIVKTQSAEYAKFRSVIVKGSDSPNFSFYGYDGGVASIIAFEVSLEEGNWDYNLVTKDYVDTAINAIKGGQSIDSFADVETALAGKVDKVTGKGLSTNDFTDTYKDKVDNNAGAIEAIVNEYGSKNLFRILKSPITSAGITITPVNGEYITISGTTTQRVDITINDDSWSLSEINTFIGSYDSTATIEIYAQIEHTGQSTRYIKLTESGAQFDITDGDILTRVFARIYADQSFNGEVIKPMIRDARIADTTYVPYVMTNRELTGAVDQLKSGLTNKATFASYTIPSGGTVNIYHSDGILLFSDRGGLYGEGVANRGLQGFSTQGSISVTHVDGNNVTVQNTSTYGTTIMIFSGGEITVTEVNS